jgi:hypothetical protein
VTCHYLTYQRLTKAPNDPRPIRRLASRATVETAPQHRHVCWHPRGKDERGFRQTESRKGDCVNDLHPYMVHDGDPSEGAALAFAHTAAEAKRIGFPVITGWNGYCRWIDVRVKRLRKHEAYLLMLACHDTPHCIDDLPTCPTCETWGAPVINGRCDNCVEPL